MVPVTVRSTHMIPLHHLSSMTDSLGRTTSYKYDGPGNLLTFIDPSGRVTTETHDASNQLISIAYGDGKTPNVAISHDADGQRTSMTDGTGTSSWTYDSLHRVVATTSGAGAHVSYLYDLKGQLIGIVYPNFQTVSRVYNAGGRLTSITDWLGNATTFTYDPGGNLVSESLPKATGITEYFIYDIANRLVSIIDVHKAEPIAVFLYQHNAVDLVTRSVELGVPLPALNVYGYISLNRISSANGSKYAYDAGDNFS
jgi:YD repeat-containing protein